MSDTKYWPFSWYSNFLDVPVFVAFGKNMPQQLKTGFVAQGHKYQLSLCISKYIVSRLYL